MKAYFILSNILCKVISLSALALSLFICITHPFFPVFAAGLFFIYLIVLIRYPDSWIFLLFVLLPTLDFGMWTGNILYSEFDAFFLETLAYLFFVKSRIKNGKFPNNFLFICFFLFFLASTLNGFKLYFYGYSNDDIHLSYLNSIRVGKGFLSAWFVWYFIRNRLVSDYENTIKLLGCGIIVGLFCFSMQVFWERHVFANIVSWSGTYNLLSVILDFSSTYRITGFFAGMHVGGTAIDGYLVCVLPLSFYIFTRQTNSHLWFLATFVFLLGVYCLIVTFTRMTIASCFLSIVIGMILSAIQSISGYKNFRRLFVKSLLVIVLIIAGAVSCYLHTGYQGLFFGLLSAVLSIVLAMYYQKTGLPLFLVGMVGIFLLCVYGVFDSVTDSLWHKDMDFYASVVYSIAFIVFLQVLGIFLGLELNRNNISVLTLRVPFVGCCVMIFLIIGVLSTRMEQRFKEVSQDILIRETHWLNVIDARTPDSVFNTLFGEGMGAMVRQYYTKYFNEIELQSYAWKNEDSKTILKLGAGGYPFHQKIKMQPNTGYSLVLSAKAEAPVSNGLGVDICHKHILFSEHWQPDCVSTSFMLGGKEWEQLKWDFNSGNLGKNGWADWPVTLQVHNYGKSPVELDFIELRTTDGEQLVENANFDNHLESWFWTSDFEHLPWHSKQLFIHIWLEQGWVGLALFLVLLGYGLVRQIKQFCAGESVPIAIIPAIIGINSLGITDTFIDEPQVSLFVFAILFAALQWPGAVEKQAHNR